ncbi:hypothetical protein JOC54_002866 [Alkalihalobacillus xiaoxiensis]|uniref:Uncharacterized protein n=1 Tax=Shouchella xiaoxiensis TaxID=766895 RepID=A0ABS2SVN3_9BACI|nr:hypothetical protein [Shouchella xiaoxiensis]MBM7839586.1 hypothetical protein [Shouchella xiaoxiensis]
MENLIIKRVKPKFLTVGSHNVTIESIKEGKSVVINNEQCPTILVTFVDGDKKFTQQIPINSNGHSLLDMLLSSALKDDAVEEELDLKVLIGKEVGISIGLRKGYSNVTSFYEVH